MKFVDIVVCIVVGSGMLAHLNTGNTFTGTTAMFLGIGLILSLMFPRQQQP